MSDNDNITAAAQPTTTQTVFMWVQIATAIAALAQVPLEKLFEVIRSAGVNDDDTLNMVRAGYLERIARAERDAR
jgi:hypothetical protein